KPETRVKGNAEIYKDIGEVKFKLTWMNAAQPVDLPVRQLVRPNGRIYVAKAMEGTLAEISELVRAKSRKTRNEINELDASIRLIAATIADGNMPWSSHSQFKPQHDQRSAAYDGTNIWTYAEHRKGGVRTYFAIK